MVALDQELVVGRVVAAAERDRIAASHGCGKPVIHYIVRDWVVGRQRNLIVGVYASGKGIA